MKTDYTFTIGIVGLFLTIVIIALFCDKGVKPKTLPHYKVDTIIADAYHCDSTGKYLIRWNGDTVNPIKWMEER